MLKENDKLITLNKEDFLTLLKGDIKINNLRIYEDYSKISFIDKNIIKNKDSIDFIGLKIINKNKFFTFDSIFIPNEDKIKIEKGIIIGLCGIDIYNSKEGLTGMICCLGVENYFLNDFYFEILIKEITKLAKEKYPELKQIYMLIPQKLF